MKTTVFIISIFLSSFLFGQVIFRKGTALNVSSFDPLKVDDAWSIQVLNQLYLKLFKIDNDGRLVPDLIESYRISKNYTQHDFCIKKMKFSDGSNIKVQDVIFSLRRAIDPQKNKLTSYYFNRIINASSISKISNLCLRIVTIVSNPTLAKILSTTSSSIIKKGFIPLDERPEKNIYSGSYVLSKYSKNKIVLKLKKSKENIEIKRIVFYVEPEEKTLKEFLKGNRDFARIPSIKEYNLLPLYIKKQTKSRLTTTIYFFLLPNMISKEKRIVIFHTLCKIVSDNIVKSVYGFSEQKINTIIPSRFYYNPNSFIKGCHFLKKNKTSVETVSIKLLVANLMSGSNSLIQKLQNYKILKQNNISIVKSDFAEIYKQYLSHKIKDILLIGFMPGYPDVEYYMREWFLQTSPSRLVAKSDIINNYLQKYSTTLDRKKKKFFLDKILAIANKNLIFVPLMEEVVTYLVNPMFKLSISPYGDYMISYDQIRKREAP